MINIARQTFSSNILIQLSRQAIHFLENTPLHPMPVADSFMGCGVYAIYYKGNHPDYLGVKNSGKPIYVGKAVPTGWRTGNISRTQETKLKLRLSEHARSIQQATNLNISDFLCRFIIIPNQDASIISVIESTLIQSLQPVWNTKIDGFGNHDPGSGRYAQAKSQWDKIHPGRPWSEKLTG